MMQLSRFRVSDERCAKGIKKKHPELKKSKKWSAPQ